MSSVISSAPAKIILFGEHGVNRQQPALATATNLRTYCRVTRRTDAGYSLQAQAHHEQGDLEGLEAFKAKIDSLRAANALDQIREEARDFFAPTRYVLAHLLTYLSASTGALGVDVEWHSRLPIGSGLGSGAAASTSMVKAVCTVAGQEIAPAAIAQAAWQGDVIAHGGVASSLDSSTSAYGGLLRYSVAAGAELLPFDSPLNFVVGDTLVAHNTAAVNTHVRRWLEEKPVRMQHFRDMCWIVRQAVLALQTGDQGAIGHLMNLHQLIQEKLGTSVLQAEALIGAALEAGALGAKISGSGGGGVIIALVEPERRDAVTTAIDQAGGRSYSVTTGSEGVRLEPSAVWDDVTQN